MSTATADSPSLQRPLSLLVCPFCRGSLEPRIARTDEVGIADGALHCAPCGVDFAVEDGLFRFDVTDKRQISKSGGEWVAEDFISLVPTSGLYYNHAQWLERHLGLPPRTAEAVAEYEWPLRIGGMLDELNPGDKPVIADIGCGVGYLLFHALERFEHLDPRLIGIDVLPEHIRYFRARQKEAGEQRMVPLLGDAARLPLPDACLDAILCSEVVEHFADRPACFAEMSRVLKPGGQLIITTPNAAPYDFYHGLRGWVQRMLGNPDRGEGFFDDPVSTGQLRALLLESGFRVVRHERNIKVPFAKRIFELLPGASGKTVVAVLERVLPGALFGMNQLASAVKNG